MHYEKRVKEVFTWFEKFYLQFHTDSKNIYYEIHNELFTIECIFYKADFEIEKTGKIESWIKHSNNLEKIIDNKIISYPIFKKLLLEAYEFVENEILILKIDPNDNIKLDKLNRVLISLRSVDLRFLHAYFITFLPPLRFKEGLSLMSVIRYLENVEEIIDDYKTSVKDKQNGHYNSINVFESIFGDNYKTSICDFVEAEHIKLQNAAKHISSFSAKKIIWKEINNQKEFFKNI